MEEVNKLVLQGMPFREAYKKIGEDIEQGRFSHSVSVVHTHQGSIGNLCNSNIQGMMDSIIRKFDFSKANKALQKLLE